jgi:hypothetical protein
MSGVDLDAIRRHMKQLSGGKKTSKNVWFYPREKNKTYNLRLVAFPDNEGQPFLTRKVYQNINDWKPVTAPFQFDLPDPVQTVIDELRAPGENEEERKNLAKKLYPRDLSYALIIDRENEEDGLKLWSMKNYIVLQIYAHLQDPEVGNIFDLVEGRDLKVTKQDNNGKTLVNVTPAMKQSEVIKGYSKDEAVRKKFEDMIFDKPDPDKLAAPPSESELADMIERWVANGGNYVAPTGNSSRFANDDDDDEVDESLSKIADQLKSLG